MIDGTLLASCAADGPDTSTVWPLLDALFELPLSNAYANTIQVTAAVTTAMAAASPMKRPRLISTVAGMD
jgi:hypothetical protein